MSNRELAKKLIDQIPESKLSYIIPYLQGAALPDQVPDNETLETIVQERLYTEEDYYALPNFIRAELFDGQFYTDDWTTLEIDEEVFRNPPSEENHVNYRLSVVKNK